MAISIETVKRAMLSEFESQAFYRLASELAEQDESRVLYLELADMEVDHARELARRLSKPPPLDLDFDALAYLEELEKGLAAELSPADEKTIRAGDAHAVLKLAKQREVVARDVFQVLARQTSDPSTKRFCEELSFTEQGHIKQLEILEAALAMPDSERPSL